MCNCDTCVNKGTTWDSIPDFDVTYTGATVVCGNVKIIEQGETVRESLNRMAEIVSENDTEELETKVEEVSTVANGADEKAQQALDEIDALPDPVTEASPSTLSLVESGRIPVSASGDEWLGNGTTYNANPVVSTLALRYTGGRLRIGNAVEDNDAVTKRQLDDAVADIDAVQADNVDGSFIENSPQSLIMKSANSRIDLLTNSTNRRNLILNSNNSSMTGYANNNAIIGCQSVHMSYGFANAGLASIIGEIGINRRNNVIIASTESVIEDWESTTTYKWNCAIIASRLGRINSSDSYTLVTGKGNTSCGSAQLVCGQNNIVEPALSVDDPLKKAFIVGNGVGHDNPELTVKSNAFHVTQGGDVWAQNRIEIDAPGQGVILKSPNGTRYMLSVDDDGNLGTVEI